MNLGKNIKFAFIPLLFLFLVKNPVFAEENSYVNVVNPVRGSEISASGSQDPLFGVKLQKQLMDKQNLFATWLLRFDILNSRDAYYFKNFSNKQELGLFLEITPLLAKSAGVSYPTGGVFWHDANKIFPSGYKPEDRIKLIDAVFAKFKEIYGYYPKSVGTWHIDAYSAEYMQRKYGITGILICADQYGTDNYQIWGGWWGVPYYPSKFNILTPAQTLKNKLNLVVFWWAARDPYLGYGGSVNESTYSVQINDYARHGLGIEYFKKLMDVYLNNKNNRFNQLTVGLENDTDWQSFSEGHSLQLEEIGRRLENKKIKVLTMREFSDWYKNSFENLSPDHQIGGWYMTTSFRAGIIENGKGKTLRDLRVYNENWPEANLLTANPWGTLSLNNPYKIDTVRFDESFKNVNFEIKLKEIIKRFGGQKIPFKFTEVFFGFYYFFLLMTLAYFLRKNLSLLLLVVFGSVSLFSTMIKSGIVYPFGMGFWGPNGHDGIWHIALINQLSKFSLENPVISGMKLSNYHFGFDLAAAVLHLVTRIPTVNLYFQIIPPLLTILIGVLTFKFVEKWTLSKSKAWWAGFFVYFGGSWGWLVSLIRTGRLGGESMFWANQSVSALINPPYALSVVILLLGLIKLLDYLKVSNKKNLLVCAFLFGVLIQIKVYVGIIVLFSLGVMSAISFFFFKNQVKKLWKLFFLSGLTAGMVFLPFNLKATSVLVFSPLWFSRTMVLYSDRLGWFKLENARIAYLNSGKWLKWLLAEGLAITIFILGNLGTRIIGFFYGGFLGGIKRKVTETEVFLFGALIISFMMPMLFIQKGNPWNTIQFFYYFQFLMAIFTGLVMGKLWEKRTGNTRNIFTCILSGIVVVLTFQTTITTLKDNYLPFRPPSRVSVEELEALNFLKRQPDGTVLAYPYNSDWKMKFSEPKPLYAYETTAYVSVFAEKNTFLADEMNLEITGYNWQPRREESLRFFLTADQNWARNFLSANKIKYIYLVKGQKMNLGLSDVDGKKIFENGETVIYEVK